MEQLSVLMKHIGCAVVALVGVVLIPLSVLACIETDNDILGRILAGVWVAEWMFVTVCLYKTIFG